MHSRIPSYLPLLLLLCAGCTRSAHPPTVANEDGFTLDLTNTSEGQRLLADSSIYCQGCTVTVTTALGRPALCLTTQAEFSDAYLDLLKLFGRPFDFTAPRYLNFDVYVPPGSAISSVKFNQLGSDGTFGGCGNYYNNIPPDARRRWVTVSVPLAEQAAYCTAWVGNGDFSKAVRALTINPFNAERSDSSTLYINRISLSDRPRRGAIEDRLAPRPLVAENNPYTITWDDRELLRRQLAYRTFEATTQSIQGGKFGNATQAIRAYGTGQNNYICLLPDIEQMTGHPVNFRAVDSLFFRYYLSPESDTVQGARLFLTSGDDWDSILLAEDFMTAGDFVRGAWTRHAVAIKDLQTTAAREPADVLAAVYELRLDLKYAPTAGPIEIWFDDFGWR